MADLTIKQGDTDPDLRGSASDAENDADAMAPLLAAADKLQVVLKKGATKIFGNAVAINPAIEDPSKPGRKLNWKYVWKAGDTDIAGTWVGELKVTWDKDSSPPKVTRFPTEGSVEVDIEANQGEPE